MPDDLFSLLCRFDPLVLERPSTAGATPAYLAAQNGHSAALRVLLSAPGQPGANTTVYLRVDRSQWQVRRPLRAHAPIACCCLLLLLAVAALLAACCCFCLLLLQQPAAACCLLLAATACSCKRLA